MRIGNIELKWLGNAGFLMEYKNVSSDNNEDPIIIYIDPYKIHEGSKKADFIFITHGHYDHCSLEDINKIVKEETKIILTAECQSKITRFNFPIKMVIVEPERDFNLNGIKFSTLPAYNIDKSFHPKGAEGVGYLINFEDVFIYHSGDTDIIPEMQKLTGYKQQGREFVALLPVGGRFTMTAEEAAEAADIIKPTLAIPMHYGSIIGSEEDANEFKELCEEKDIKVKILEKE